MGKKSCVAINSLFPNSFNHSFNVAVVVKSFCDSKLVLHLEDIRDITTCWTRIAKNMTIPGFVKICKKSNVG